MRAKSVMMQQLLTDGLSNRQRLAMWTAEEIDRAIDLSVNALPDFRDALPFLKEVQSKVNARQTARVGGFDDRPPQQHVLADRRTGKATA